MLARKIRWWREIDVRLSLRDVSFDSEEELLKFYHDCIDDILNHSFNFDEVIDKHLSLLQKDKSKDSIVESSVQLEEPIPMEETIITNEEIQVIPEKRKGRNAKKGN